MAIRSANIQLSVSVSEELSYLDLSLMSTRETRLVRRARQDRGEMVKGFQQGGLLVAVRAPGAYLCNTVGVTPWPVS